MEQNSSLVEIAWLADHLEAIPTLAEWFRAQWPDYFAQDTQAEVEQEFRLQAGRTGLPVRLVAFVDGQLAGTIVLRERALASVPDFHPGLGGLFVAEKHRTRGIGTELVRAGMGAARQQGYRVVYAGTVAAISILKRLGWVPVKVVTTHDERVTLYRCELTAAAQHGVQPTPLTGRRYEGSGD